LLVDKTFKLLNLFVLFGLKIRNQNLDSLFDLIIDKSVLGGPCTHE